MAATVSMDEIFDEEAEATAKHKKGKAKKPVSSGWETVRDELEETKNVSGNMTVCFKTDTESSMRPGNRLV